MFVFKRNMAHQIIRMIGSRIDQLHLFSRHISRRFIQISVLFVDFRPLQRFTVVYTPFRGNGRNALNKSYVFSFVIIYREYTMADINKRPDSNNKEFNCDINKRQQVLTVLYKLKSVLLQMMRSLHRIWPNVYFVQTLE